MAIYINNQKVSGGGGGDTSTSEHVTLTYAEWEALTPAEKMSDTVYIITDASSYTKFETETLFETLNSSVNTGLDNLNSSFNTGLNSLNSSISQNYATQTYVNDIVGNINLLLDSI